MTLLGTLHVGFGLAAIASGAAVLLRRKGTASHRRLGWAYAAAMLGLTGSAMLIYRLISWIFIAAIGWVVFFFMFRTEKDIDPDATIAGRRPEQFRPGPDVRHERES